MGEAIRSWTTALMSSIGVREGKCTINNNQEGSSGRKNDPPMLPSGGAKNSSCSEDGTFYCSCGSKLKEEGGELIEV
tara:strand:+ start:1397 stop:1627 length:231 start_codon:yes stop_codon:yes gene_type:complete